MARFADSWAGAALTGLSVFWLAGGLAAAGLLLYLLVEAAS